MNYTLHQLNVFLTITELGSVTKAAEALHLTQPAVSIQLKNLQDQFEIPLTEVVGRQLYITDFGKEIALASQNIINEVEIINQKLITYQDQIAGKLKVSVVSTGKYIMPYFLTDFLKKNPGVELKMDVTNKASVVRSLEKNEVDFSLVSIPPSTLALEHITLMQNKLFLVGNASSELKVNKPYKSNVLESIDLIFRETGSGTRQTIEKHINQQNLTVKRKMELTSNEAVKQAVVAGLGHSIMPLIGIKNELELGDLKIIPVKGLPIQSQWQLVWLKNKKFSPAAKAYLDYLIEHKDEIITKKFEWYESP
ncbi:LysR family transcriptional regulator [Roseivirga misakiensis]|uniref:LysR family transcriptional regulator n=1 Tax=Roseivirga misakiensis TaxID=1563681 RepID=A0A1E5T0X8_9BACT|nr:LysR family transcriptional regulator [Roseivirga misakiensis]OEK05019.1 LysR family transcriptional regulator [Roseivirga misakiensis]